MGLDHDGIMTEVGVAERITTKTYILYMSKYLTRIYDWSEVRYCQKSRVWLGSN